MVALKFADLFIGFDFGDAQNTDVRFGLLADRRVVFRRITVA